MKRLLVEARSHTTAAPEVLWELLADSEGYSKWGPWRETGYETKGDSSAGGVGAVRRLRTGRRTFFEQIEEVDPPRRMVYTVVKGIPSATTGLRSRSPLLARAPTSGGAPIGTEPWRARLVHRKLRAAYPQIVQSLITAAETVTDSSG